MRAYSMIYMIRTRKMLGEATSQSRKRWQGGRGGSVVFNLSFVR